MKKKKKKTCSIFIASLVIPIHLISQISTFTPISNTIPAASHFDKLGYKPKNNENKEIIFSNSFTEPTFLKKGSYIGRYFQEFLDF